ncbi:MAG: hypothetical protein MRJ92_01500 [Nitrospira sp.]|nr:hypothetical protein [Nitrospira sp.]
MLKVVTFPSLSALRLTVRTSSTIPLKTTITMELMARIERSHGAMGTGVKKISSGPRTPATM